jgi:hypothetical protein
MIALDRLEHGRYSVQAGGTFHAGPRDAARLVALGRAKMADEHLNKMAAEVANKSRPFPGGGKAAPLSASRRVRASPGMTAPGLPSGARRARATARLGASS